MFTMWYGISCSFLVIITHSCCALALVCYYHQKAHSIPYHTVNTWNSVVNPSILPSEIMLTVQISRDSCRNRLVTCAVSVNLARVRQTGHLMHEVSTKFMNKDQYPWENSWKTESRPTMFAWHIMSKQRTLRVMFPLWRHYFPVH